jgi:hypothetical protein
MAQVVECLPGKDEILSSNSSTGKKKIMCRKIDATGDHHIK